MPALTLFPDADTAVGGGQDFGSLTATSPGADADTATGWTYGKIASSNYAEMDRGTELATTAFGATVLPNATLNGTAGDAFRTGLFAGTFASGNWVFTFQMRSISGASGAGRLRLRIFRSANADGSSATELTGAAQVTTIRTNSTTAGTITVTWAPGVAITLNNEYLFVTIAWEITTAGGTNSHDVLFRKGTSTTLVTPIFSGVDAATVYLALTPSGTDLHLGARTVAASRGTFDNPTSPASGATTAYVRARFASGSGFVRFKVFEGATQRATADFTLTSSFQTFSMDVPSIGNYNNLEWSVEGRREDPPGALTPEVADVWAVVPVAAVGFTDSATINFLLTPSGSDILEAVESQTIKLTFTPSGTEEKQQYDADTIRLGLTPSSADVAAYVDAATALVQLTPSGTEQLVSGAVDAATVYLSLIPSSADTAQYVEANTVRLTFTPSGADTAQYQEGLIYAGDDVFPTDTPALLKLTPSGTDERQQYDAATVVLKLIPSGTELKESTDSNSVKLAFTPSGTDIAAYVDTATVPLGFTPSAADIAQYVESATVNLLFIPSGTDTKVTAGGDADTVKLTLTPSGTDPVIFLDSATINFKLTPSGTDERTQFDSATINFLTTPSGTEEKQQYDAATIDLRFAPSGTDEKTQFDTAQVKLAFTPSGTEFRESLDSATTTLRLTPTSTDIAQYVDANTVPLALTPSGTEVFSQTGQDLATVPIRFTVTSTDVLETTDSATVNIRFTPSGADVVILQDEAVVPLVLTPTGTEAKVSVDAATVYLTFTPVAFVPSISYILTSAAYLRWRTPFAELRWSTPLHYRRWTDGN